MQAGAGFNEALAAAAEAGEIEDPAASVPALSWSEGLVWSCFQDCGTCRALGPAGVGPIPWNIVQEWLDRRGIHDPDDRAHFEDLVYRLDDCRAKHQAAELRRLSSRGVV